MRILVLDDHAPHGESLVELLPTPVSPALLLDLLARVERETSGLSLALRRSFSLARYGLR
ncbi:MAG: hypothetical protein HY721_29425 [Planctomycetes bacterium]|nr:hypothetical protein [Planctomycetota bacterium]